MEGGLDNHRNLLRRRAEDPGQQSAPPQESEARKVPDKFVVLLPGDLPESPMGGRYAIDDTIDVAATPGAFVRNGYKLRLLNEEDRPHFKVENAIHIAELDTFSPPPETTPGTATTVPNADTATPGATDAERTAHVIDGTGQVNQISVDELREQAARRIEGSSSVEEEREAVWQGQERVRRAGGIRNFIANRIRGSRDATPAEVDALASGVGGGNGGRGNGEPPGPGANAGREGPRVPQPGDLMNGQASQGQGERFRLDPTKFKESDYTGIKLKTLQAIQASESDQLYFGMMLQKRGAPDELMLRWKTNQTRPEDRNYLTYAAYEYSKWMQIAQETGNKIATPDTLALLAKHHPEMRNLVTALNEPGAINRAKGVAIRLAMEDPVSMKALSDTVYDLDETRKTFSYKRWDKKIEGQRDRLGLTRAEYGKMMDLGGRANRGETVDRLQKHIHDRAGAARRVLDSIEKGMLLPLTLPLSSRAKALREVERAMSITPQWGGPSNIPLIGGFLTRMGAGNRAANMRTNMLDRMNGDLKTIAQHMGDTLVKNPDVINAVMQEALENRPITPESERGPRTFAAMQRENADEATRIRTSLDRIVQEYPDWNERTRDQKEQILEQMRPSIEREMQTQGMGFFAWLTRILFGKNWNAAVSQRLAQPRAATA